MDLVQVLAAHRAHLLQAYRGPSWDVVAENYAVPPGPREAQLRAALISVEAWARSFAPDPALAAHLDTFVKEAMDEVGPKTGATAGLGMIFANATASVGWWAAQRAQGTSYVATCVGCAGSQTRPLQFKCQYCGEALYEELR